MVQTASNARIPGPLSATWPQLLLGHTRISTLDGPTLGQLPTVAGREATQSLEQLLGVADEARKLDVVGQSGRTGELT